VRSTKNPNDYQKGKNIMSESVITQSTAGPDVSADYPVYRPRYTVRQAEGAYEVGVVLPGVKREDVSVRLEEGVLHVEGTRREASPEGWRVLRREIGGVKFVLELRVTVPVDATRISAKLEDGILSLRLPVREEAKAREIAIE
jgi:HSP20 family protein